MKKNNKIIIINGSSKVKRGTSMHIIQWLKNELPEAVDISYREKLELEKDKTYTLIFVTPIYVDGIPSHLLEFMEELSHEKINSRVHVFFIAAGGLPQNSNNTDIYSIMDVFCTECNLIFHGGITLGMSQFIRNSGFTLWLNKQVFKSMKRLIRYVRNADKCGISHEITNPKIANILFVLFGNLYWIVINIYKNGIPKKIKYQRYKKEKLFH